ncbi:MAG: hypothetical protein WCS77_10600, partial [Elusimicrobiaceae bacterium]
MKRIARSVFISSVLLLSVNTAWPALHVTAVTPQGVLTEDGGAPAVITVMFNEPVSALSAPSEKQRCPFRVEPEISGKCYWSGPQTAVFKPDLPFEKSRKFKVLVPKGLAAANGDVLAAAVEKTFVTPLPELLNSVPGNNSRWISHYPTVFLQFNQPVNYKAAQAFITIEDEAGTVIPSGVRKAKPEELEKVFPSWSSAYNSSPVKPSTANVLAVKPVVELKAGKYTLTVKEGFPGQGGEPAEAAGGVVFYVYGGLDVAGSPGEQCLPGRFTVSFTNPVRYADFWEHIKISPALKMPPLPSYVSDEFGRANNDDGVYEHDLPAFSYEPGAAYTVTMTRGLADVFGDTLDVDRSFPVSNTGYCPKFTMGDGFGVLEKEFAPLHPYKSVNVSSLTYVSFSARPDNVIPFYNKISNGDFANAAPDGVAVQSAQFNAPADRKYYGGIKLSSALGASAGGMVFTGVLNPLTWKDWLWSYDSVTGIGVTFKASSKKSLVWTTELTEGKPLGRVNIALRDGNNSLLWSGKTDGDGLAVLPG